MATFLDTIDPKRTGLLLIEYQNEFTTENGKLHEAVKNNISPTRIRNRGLLFIFFPSENPSNKKMLEKKGSEVQQ